MLQNGSRGCTGSRYLYMNIYTHICIYLHTYTYIFVCVYLCIYVYIYTCIFLSVCIHICTYIHMYKRWCRKMACAGTEYIYIHIHVCICIYLLATMCCPALGCSLWIIGCLGIHTCVSASKYCIQPALHLIWCMLQCTATRCNIPATHCNALQYTGQPALCLRWSRWIPECLWLRVQTALYSRRSRCETAPICFTNSLIHTSKT